MSDRAPNSGLGADGQRGVGDDARINHAARALANTFWRGGGDEQYHFLLWMCGHVVRTVLAAAQPPAPEPPDAASVLAGLLAGFEHERWWSADDEVKFEIWTKAMKRVEAAQQRLADRGQSGGSGG